MSQGSLVPTELLVLQSSSDHVALQCPHGPLLPQGPAVSQSSQNDPGWKRALRTSSATCDPIPPCHPDHGTQCHMQSFLKHFQVPSLTHFPGQPIPMPSHHFCEEYFLMSILNLLWCTLRLCPLILSLFPGKRAQSQPGCTLLSGSCRD